MSEDEFQQLPLFHGLSKAQIDALRPMFLLCTYEADTLLFEQGSLADNLYVVVSGAVVVNFKPDDGPPIAVARIEPGGVVGWSAALGSQTYTSAAVCATPTKLLRVRGADLRKLCGQDSELSAIILDRLASLIAKRLKNTHEQVKALLTYGLGNGVQCKEVRDDSTG